MKTRFTLGLVGLLGAALLCSAGCVERRVVYVMQPPGSPPAAGTVVNAAPPPPQTEVVAIAPGPEYLWVPGYWSWNNGWVWIGGRWSLRPHPHAVWGAPHYVRRGHGYVYFHGYWR